MHRRLVPALVLVSLLVAPLAGVPVGGATATPPAAAVHSAQSAPASNATSTLPGVGVVGDAAPAPDGGTYLVGATAPQAPNLTLTRLAADGSVVWQRQFGGPNDSRVGRSVVATGDGAYVLERVGPATAGPSPRAPATVRLLHLSTDGEVQWRRVLGNASRLGPGGDVLAADGDGVVYARPARSETATRLVRVAADGSVDWSRTHAGGTPRALAVGADGDYLLAGQHSYGEGWLLRLGADGTVEVNRTYGGFHDRRVVGVVPTDDGGALLAGSAEVRGFGWGDPWVARVDADGVPVWSRTYPGEQTYPRAAVPTDAGVLLVHSTTSEFGDRGTRLTHVGSDGAAGTLTLATAGVATTPRVTDGTVRLYGYEYDRRNRSIRGTVRTVALPGPDSGAGVRTGLTSNATVYRGQDLRFDGAAGVSYGLYRLPDEDAEFDEPRLVRRLRADGTGTASFETATLSSGTYAVRAEGGFWLVFEDGEESGLALSAGVAAFELDDQRLRIARPRVDRDRRGPVFVQPGPNRTVVETFRGERGVRVRIESDRESFTARVDLTRLNGSSPSASALGAALAADPQFGGTVEGASGDRPYGTVGMPAGGDRNVTLDAGALPAGLYRLSVTPLDTADAADPATTRLVVVTREREVSLSPANDSLAVPAGGSATTNLTLAGADAGVGAIRIEANRTGGPPVRLRLEFSDAVETGSASAGAGIGPDRSSAEVQSTEVRRSPNGTFTVARLSVGSERHFASDEEPVTGTDALTVGLVWVVDADGVPYSPAEPVTVRYEVTEAPDADSDADGDE